MSPPDEERPVVEELPYSSVDRAALLVSGCAIAATGVVLSALWPDLPERVPMHFGVSGAPDAWGARATLLVPLLILVPIDILLLVLLRIPHVYNYPVRVTKENARALYTIGRRTLLLTQTFVNTTICTVVILMALVAKGTLATLPVFWLPALLVALLGIVVWSFRASRAASR
jgi:uncharacterized membrane protein